MSVSNLAGLEKFPVSQDSIRYVAPLVPLVFFCLGWETHTLGQADSPSTRSNSTPLTQAEFIQNYCQSCHQAKKQEADFRVDNLLPLSESRSTIEEWEKIRELVSLGDMPPSDAKQPSKTLRKAFLRSLETDMKSAGFDHDSDRSAFPTFANRLDHDELFSGEHRAPAYTKARVWRQSSYIYDQMLRDLELSDFTVPLTELNGEGFKDYAMLYADEATIRTLMQNAKRVAMGMVHGRLVKPRGAAARNPKNKSHRKNSRHRTLLEFALSSGTPSKLEQQKVIEYGFQVLLNRSPDPEELDRYQARILGPSVQSGGADAGLRGFLVTLLLSPEFMFRMEMGLGEKLPDGRRMLGPSELAFAISYALYDRPVQSLIEAAQNGKLTTRKDVEQQVRRLLDSTSEFKGNIPVARREHTFWHVGKLGTKDVDKPRMLRFFREFFDYEKAKDVFKDDIRHGGKHDARKLVEDADWFVLSILAKDQNVFGELLTSDKYYISFAKKKYLGYAIAYNIGPEERKEKSPSDLPEGQRAGILTHPAWLVAHSGNFENDPVRRGKWIREKLLAGVVPDIPIGVEAQLPDAPHQTLRKRFEVVNDSQCWRCHKKMNPLGNPFEAYDDFGRYRTMHHVSTEGDVIASDLEINRNRRGLVAKPTLKVDTSGELIGTGEKDVDGQVASAVELVHRLARSTKARQSFIRHVFRYWMGRNETPIDSPTLIKMDQAYINHNGSFKEVLVALLTSDSFLMRK